MNPTTAEPILQPTELPKSSKRKQPKEIKPKETRPFELHELKRAMSVGAVTGIILEGTLGGFLMRIEFKEGDDGLLHERRGQPRVFRLAQTAVALAKQIGMNQIAFSRLQEWRPEEQPLF